MPSTYSGSADKKWNFVDESYPQDQWAPQGEPMYFPPPPVMFVARRPAGEVLGKKVEEIQIQAGFFMAKIYTYGAILAEMCIPDGYGAPVDVVLGFNSVDSYVKKHPFFGANCGRVANRIGGANFSIGDETYTLAKNNGENNLHGGDIGWDKAVWTISEMSSNECWVTMTHTSPDGDEGFPGEVKASITYSLSPVGVLRIDFAATVSKATPVNMAHHSYWNLAGHASGTVCDHAIQVAADTYTVTEGLIPTGEIRAVDGTPLDLRIPQPLKDAMEKNEGGFDDNFCLTGEKEAGAELHFAASLQDPSGRYMEVHTSAPGVQVYTADGLDGTIRGKHGAVYCKNAGICLETQGYPDSVNHPHFPSVIVEPDGNYIHTVEYRFFC